MNDFFLCLTLVTNEYIAGKMKRILCSDRLPIGVPCPLGIARFVPAKAGFFGVIFRPYNKSSIHQPCSVKMAGYWPRSFFAFLWTSTSSQSIKTQKKNLANIQPS